MALLSSFWGARDGGWDEGGRRRGGGGHTRELQHDKRERERERVHKTRWFDFDKDMMLRDDGDSPQITTTNCNKNTSSNNNTPAEDARWFRDEGGVDASVEAGECCRGGVGGGGV